MLTLNPEKRITASEALRHPWIRQPEVVAPRVHLAKTIGHLRKFNARRKFRVSPSSFSDISWPWWTTLDQVALRDEISLFFLQAAALAAVAAQKFFKKGSSSGLRKGKQLRGRHGSGIRKTKTGKWSEDMYTTRRFSGNLLHIGCTWSCALIQRLISNFTSRKTLYFYCVCTLDWWYITWSIDFRHIRTG